MTWKLPKRRQRRYDLAEDACRAFRKAIAKPNCEQTQEDWNLALDYLLAWMSLVGKSP